MWQMEPPTTPNFPKSINSFFDKMGPQTIGPNRLANAFLKLTLHTTFHQVTKSEKTKRRFYNNLTKSQNGK